MEQLKLFPGYFGEFAFNFLPGAPLGHHFPDKSLILCRDLPPRLFNLLFLHLLHQQRQISILLKVPGKHLLVFSQELLVVLFRQHFSLLFHQLHILHIELWTGLYLLNDLYEIVACLLQLSTYLDQYQRDSSQIQSFCSLKASISNFQFSSSWELLFINIMNIINPYLQSILNLRKEFKGNLTSKVSRYHTYEDYLHQRITNSSLQPTTASTLKQVKVSNRGESRASGEAVTVKASPEERCRGSLVYYPVERTQLEYKTNSYIEKKPVTKKVVDYVEKREIQLIPKEVSKMDYYAVETIRQYVRQVVPQVKVEKIAVPKTIKTLETVPVQKQIIFYPNQYDNLQQGKRQARQHLQKKGVIIKQNAEYRPISQKQALHQSFLQSEQPQLQMDSTPGFVSHSTEVVPSQQIQQAQTKSESVQIQSADKPYIRLARPQNRDTSANMNGQTCSMIKKTSIGEIPTYQQSKYSMVGQQELTRAQQWSIASSKQTKKTVQAKYLKGSVLSGHDYTFSQRDQFRYDMAMYNSSKRLKG